MKIDFGKFRHRITIEQQANADDGAGGYTQSWSTFITAWGQVVPVNGNERFFAQRVEAILSHRIYLRVRSGVTTSMRVKATLKGALRTFQIHSVINVNEENDYLMLLCQEGVGT